MIVEDRCGDLRWSETMVQVPHVHVNVWVPGIVWVWEEGETRGKSREDGVVDSKLIGFRMDSG